MLVSLTQISDTLDSKMEDLTAGEVRQLESTEKLTNHNAIEFAAKILRSLAEQAGEIASMTSLVITAKLIHVTRSQKIAQSSVD